jgi:dolichol-phosphate mannosyltransferase
MALNIKYGNIRTYIRPGKLGLSSAVLLGFDKANSKVLAVIDADMQHPPEILAKMLPKISQGFDLVVASRYTEGGGSKDWELHRIVLSRGGNLLAHLVFPNSRKVKDVMSGCFMFRKDAADGVHLNPIGFKILLEILAKCEFKLVYEVPIVFINRNNGRSNLNLTEIGNFITHILKIFSSKLRNLD